MNTNRHRNNLSTGQILTPTTAVVRNSCVVLGERDPSFYWQTLKEQSLINLCHKQLKYLIKTRVPLFFSRMEPTGSTVHIGKTTTVKD